MNKMTKILSLLFLVFLISQLNFAQTTGKIAGKITDKNTGEALYGANVLIVGTSMGAAVNDKGEYYIINISPGEYSLRVSMMGYSPVLFEGVTVSVNRTTTIDAELSQEDFELGEVVVSVQAITKKKDQTSSINNVSSEQIKSLPVEDISDVVNLQAGVVQGHFRGGRSTEVSYMVDGVAVTDGFSRESYNVEVETEAVQDMEVITGTFNAEYGKAMSGIVNVVTKEGTEKFHGSASSSVSGYLTSNSDIFIGLDDDYLRNEDYKIQLEGPIYKNYITFFANARYENKEGYLNGIRRFNVDDYSDFSHGDVLDVSTPWDYDYNGTTYYSEHTGDSSYVPMAASEDYSLMGKITFKILPNTKFSFLYSKSYDESQSYDHDYKYKPDGRPTSYTDNQFFLFQINNVLSKSMFHDLKVSYNTNDWEEYLYKDPYDSRYVAENYSSSVGGFVSGGNDKGYESVTLSDLNIKYDITWQLNVHHSLKTGIEYTRHDLTRENLVVQDVKTGTSELDEYYYDEDAERMVFNPYEAEVLDSAVSADNYNKKPYELSAYIQDKMEYESLVINYGIRYDYFNPNTVYPSNLRNPANQITYTDYPERMSDYLEADPQQQISPRFGLSYSLGEAAVLHFSYGHFFQMPPLYALYQNSAFKVASSDYSDPVHGNPNLKAEKTVQYEMGLWQEVTGGLGVEVSVFYRDIYDLLSTTVITTYNSIKYGRYTNKDYGNVKGLEFKLDYYNGDFSAFLNYTLQYTRGIADDPTTAFTRSGENLSEVTTLIPLSWDQRHTLNINVEYSKDNYGVDLIGTFNSGAAYSYEPVEDNPLSKVSLYPNNAYKPSTFDLSLKSHYDFGIADNVKMRLSLSVYNLLDNLNETSVDASTGRAYTTILTASEISTFKSNYNDVYDQYRDPSMYAAPREVKLGVGIVF